MVPVQNNTVRADWHSSVSPYLDPVAIVVNAAQIQNSMDALRHHHAHDKDKRQHKHSGHCDTDRNHMQRFKLGHISLMLFATSNTKKDAATASTVLNRLRLTGASDSLIAYFELCIRSAISPNGQARQASSPYDLVILIQSKAGRCLTCLQRI
jgi:hypothetical protein